MSVETDRRHDIIVAALNVFSEHGYHKASIKQIAKAADLKSTSHIYWYFEDKKALLTAVLHELSPLRNLPVLDETFQAMALDMPPEQFFTLVMTNLLALQDDPQTITVMRLYMSEAFRQPEIADVLAGFQQTMSGFLDRYFQHQVDVGRLRDHNVQAAARMMLGTGIINLLGHQVFTKMAESFPDRETYIREVVQIMLRGLEM